MINHRLGMIIIWAFVRLSHVMSLSKIDFLILLLLTEENGFIFKQKPAPNLHKVLFFWGQK